MKIKFIILLFMIINIANAQWDKIPLKSIFYYSGYSYRVKLIGYNGDNNKEDTIQQRHLDTFSMKLDTIINLSGSKRSLIAFSKCVDCPLLNIKRIIVKGRIEDLPKDKYGVLDYSLYKSRSERDKATILYQSNTEIYTITAPRDFFITVLKNKFLVNKLDSAILNLGQDNEGLSHQLLNDYVFFDGMSLPIIPFVELNKSITKPDKDFEDQFYVYGDVINSNGIGFFNYANWYNYTTKWSSKNISISEKYGIVESDYENEGANNISKGAVIKLIKVDVPH